MGILPIHGNLSLHCVNFPEPVVCRLTGMNDEIKIVCLRNVCLPKRKGLSNYFLQVKVHNIYGLYLFV